MKTPFLPSIFSAVAILALTSCGQEPAEPTKSDAPKPAADAAKPAATGITLAVIPKSTGGEFWETVGQGAKAAAAKEGVAIRWEGTLTETEIAEQNKIIENMINLGVKGIALAPLNKKAQSKLVERAVDAGIPVVIFDSDVEGTKHSSFVATDNKNGGVIGGTELVRLIGDRKGAKDRKNEIRKNQIWNRI